MVAPKIMDCAGMNVVISAADVVVENNNSGMRSAQVSIFVLYLPYECKSVKASGSE